MTDCVFRKIVRREIPAEIVYEDENFLAFLDINPQSPGHTQIIPKQHYRFVWDVPQVGDYFEIVKKIALAQQQAFGEEMIWSKVMGDEVPHAHIWVFPRPQNSGGQAHPETSGDKEDFATNAGKIRKFLVPSMGITSFKKIMAWQKAKILTVQIYKLFSQTRDFGFKDQIQRASVSIMNNIAEGFERQGTTEFKRFLVIAKASCAEVYSMLELASELGYLSVTDFEKLSDLSTEVSKMLYGLIQSLRAHN